MLDGEAWKILTDILIQLYGRSENVIFSDKRATAESEHFTRAREREHRDSSSSSRATLNLRYQSSFPSQVAIRSATQRDRAQKNFPQPYLSLDLRNVAAHERQRRRAQKHNFLTFSFPHSRARARAFSTRNSFSQFLCVHLLRRGRELSV